MSTLPGDAEIRNGAYVPRMGYLRCFRWDGFPASLFRLVGPLTLLEVTNVDATEGDHGIKTGVLTFLLFLHKLVGQPTKVLNFTTLQKRH